MTLQPPKGWKDFKKNALDYFWSEFSKKPIAVAAASPGRMGGINASVQLQHVILSLGAYPLPLKFLVPDVQNVFDESLNFKNERTDKSAQKFLNTRSLLLPF